MSNNMFSTKKIDAKKAKWITKSVIGMTILAIVGALGFGVYQAAGPGDTLTREKRSHRVSSTRHNDSVPKFANKSITGKSQNKKALASKKHSKKPSKKLTSKGKKSQKKFAANKKGSKSYKADLSKLNKKSKKQLAKGKPSKRQAKNLAAK